MLESRHFELGMGMQDERWRQVDKIFHDLIDQTPERRASFLDEVCANDPSLKKEVEQLVEAYERSGSFLESPAFAYGSLIGRSDQAALPFASLVRESIAHFQILSLLGTGGMGEVWLAQDTRLGRKVAVKVLSAELVTQPGQVRRFAQEARAASALNHPNIITIFEIGDVQTRAGVTHYIVTEYVEGETLRQRIARTVEDKSPLRMPFLEGINIALQVASALAAAHAASITHRDIKPENVMVRPDGYVKVLDFGLAKLTEAMSTTGRPTPKPAGHSTPHGLVVGTPHYMSPEQARGEEVDARTDIFSLGVMLYEMVAGRTPFEGATTNEVLAAILRDEPLPLTQYAPEAGVELENIVCRALCKDRLQRYQTVADLLTDLKELTQRIELRAQREMDPVRNSGNQGTATDLVRKPRKGLAPAPGAITSGLPRNRKPVLGEKDVVLLADFDNQTGDAVFDGTLKQALAIQLQQSPFFSLFPEERVRQTLRLMTRSTEERVTPTVATEICVRHNLKALIIGSIALLGSHYVIVLTALHGQTGEALGSELVEAKSKEQVLRALARAATRLRAKLGESLGSIQRFDKGLEETTTQKLEAFQAYSLGYEQSLNGRMMDAIQLYKRAVELDPNFAYAWSMLSVHHSLTGRSDLAAHYAEKAYELKERVSDYEQIAITFRYHFMRTGDMNKALDAATLFKRTYPRTSTAPIDLLVAYDLIGQDDQAVAEGREAIRLNPSFAPGYWYLGRALLHANRFDEAKTVLKRALEQKFDLTNIHSVMYLIAFSEGDTASMQRELDWANGRPEKYVPLEWLAATAAFEGQWSRAKEVSRFAIELAAHGETKELAARYATEQALRGAVLEDYSGAKAAAAQGLKIADGRISLPRAALVYALCGDVNEVKMLQEELIQRFPEDTVINSIWLPIIRAALDLRTGHHARAVGELQATVVYEAAAEFWPQYLRASAYLRLGRTMEAANEFRKILDCRGQAPLSPLYALSHLQLGRAAVLSGNTASGRKAYEDFLTLWKEADSDLSILKEARHEYSLVPANK